MAAPAAAFVFVPLPKEVALRRPDGLVEWIRNSMGAKWNEGDHTSVASWEVEDAFVEFGNNLAHCLLQGASQHPEKRVTWPFPVKQSSDFIVDPLHRDHENRPLQRSCENVSPARMEEEYGAYFTVLLIAIYTRWIEEFHKLHDNKLDLSARDIGNLAKLMRYVLWWTDAGSVYNLGSLAVMLAIDQNIELLFLWRALGLQQSLFTTRLEKYTFQTNAPLYASISSCLLLLDDDPTVDPATTAMDELTRSLGIVPRSFLGRAWIEHAEYFLNQGPEVHPSSCSNQTIFTFDHVDAAGRVWPLVGCFGLGPNHDWIWEVRCADTGIALSGLRKPHRMFSCYHVAHEAFFSHPLSREFVLSDEELARVIPEEKEYVPHQNMLPICLVRVESYKFWKPRTLALIKDKSLSRRRLAVLQSKWNQIRDLCDYSRYSPRLWRGKVGQPPSPLSPTSATLKQLQVQLEETYANAQDRQDAALDRHRKTLYGLLLDHTNLPEVLAHLITLFVCSQKIYFFCLYDQDETMSRYRPCSSGAVRMPSRTSMSRTRWMASAW